MMFGLLAHRLSVLAASAALVVAASTIPAPAEATGLIAGPRSAETANQTLTFKPDMQVMANGVHVDSNGNTFYRFTIQNVGLAPANGVKVTKLSQIKEVAYPQKVKNTITVLAYDVIPSGQEKPITILCEKSLLYSCKYGSVQVEVQNPEMPGANNYASQVAL